MAGRQELMFPLPNGETVQRERAALAEDPFSGEQTVREWSDPDTIDLVGVAIAPSSSNESLASDRNTVTTSMSLYGPPGIDVLPFDRIRARSGLWEVEGEVADWKNAFTGWNPGVEFRVKKVVG
ncbi:hypothetical protein ACIPWF_00770 [Paenarthrobacter sp. NPDC089989]|uniref:hypothetical protein n=1 Tax=unclassified Paenarthrobacter TaxID=2634190 RepID=UPI0037FFD52E